MFRHVSSRGFATYTGLYKGVPVTVIGTGMGYSMIDFSVRECTAVVQGPMAMIRVGTCGSVDRSLKCGDISVTDKAVFLNRNPNAFRKNLEEQTKANLKCVTMYNSGELSYFQMSDSCQADPNLTKLVKFKLIVVG